MQRIFCARVSVSPKDAKTVSQLKQERYSQWTEKSEIAFSFSFPLPITDEVLNLVSLSYEKTNKSEKEPTNLSSQYPHDKLQ